MTGPTDTRRISPPEVTRKGPPDVLPLLHRPPDLRQRHRDRHDARRRRRAVSACRSSSIPRSRRRRSRSRTNYPGANAEVVADTVAAPIEQQVNGVENMLYMSSTSLERRLVLADGHLRDRHRPRHGAGAGAEPGGDRRAAAARGSPAAGRHGQEAVDEHHPGRLADLARRARTTACSWPTTPRSGSRDELSRDPRRRRRDRLRQRRLQHAGLARPGQAQGPQPDDRRTCSRASASRTCRSPPGRSASRPRPSGQDFQYTVTTLGRLSDAEQFEDIIVKTGDGRPASPTCRTSPASSWARRPTTQFACSNGLPAASIGIFQLPGANALDVADGVREAMERLEPGRSREGMEYDIPFDTTQVRRGVDPRGLHDAARGRRPGADRDPGLPAGLAGRAGPGDDRAGDDHRRVRRHGRCWASRSTC